MEGLEISHNKIYTSSNQDSHLSHLLINKQIKNFNEEVEKLRSIVIIDNLDIQKRYKHTKTDDINYYFNEDKIMKEVLDAKKLQHGSNLKKDSIQRNYMRFYSQELIICMQKFFSDNYNYFSEEIKNFVKKLYEISDNSNFLQLIYTKHSKKEIKLFFLSNIIDFIFFRIKYYLHSKVNSKYFKCIFKECQIKTMEELLKLYESDFRNTFKKKINWTRTIDVINSNIWLFTSLDFLTYEICDMIKFKDDGRSLDFSDLCATGGLEIS